MGSNRPYSAIRKTGVIVLRFPPWSVPPFGSAVVAMVAAIVTMAATIVTTAIETAVCAVVGRGACHQGSRSRTRRPSGVAVAVAVAVAKTWMFTC